jgi:hypothetical protein
MASIETNLFAWSAMHCMLQNCHVHIQLFASNYPCHLLLNFASLVLLGKAGKN